MIPKFSDNSLSYPKYLFIGAVPEFARQSLTANSNTYYFETDSPLKNVQSLN
jgi:hypothetical protein